MFSAPTNNPNHSNVSNGLIVVQSAELPVVNMQQHQQIISPTLDSIRTVQSNATTLTSVTNTASNIRSFPTNYYSNGSSLYTTENFIKSSNNNTNNNSLALTSQQVRQQPLFSVSSLVNMSPSPAPKSLDMIDLNMKTSLVNENSQQIINNNCPISFQLESQHEHSAQISKEIFNACKIGDLVKLKKYLNSNNVNIRDSSGGRSTVCNNIYFEILLLTNSLILTLFCCSIVVAFCIWIWSFGCSRVSFTKWRKYPC